MVRHVRMPRGPVWTKRPSPIFPQRICGKNTTTSPSGLFMMFMAAKTVHRIALWLMFIAFWGNLPRRHRIIPGSFAPPKKNGSLWRWSYTIELKNATPSGTGGSKRKNMWWKCDGQLPELRARLKSTIKCGVYYLDYPAELLNCWMFSDSQRPNLSGCQISEFHKHHELWKRAFVLILQKPCILLVNTRCCVESYFFACFPCGLSTGDIKC